MSRIAPHRNRQRLLAAYPKTRTVCIVDPHPADYRGWESLAEAGGVELRFAASAAEALRLGHQGTIDLWVVNTELPGLSGIELCGMLRQRTQRPTVVLVTDDASADAERKAWAAGPALVFCKPAHVSWLEAWLRTNSTPPAPRTASTHHASIRFLKQTRVTWRPHRSARQVTQQLLVPSSIPSSERDLNHETVPPRCHAVGLRRHEPLHGRFGDFDPAAVVQVYHGLQR